MNWNYYHGTPIYATEIQKLPNGHVHNDILKYAKVPRCKYVNRTAINSKPYKIFLSKISMLDATDFILNIMQIVISI